MKTCGRCKLEKPVDAFGLRTNGRPCSYCRPCQREYRQEYQKSEQGRRKIQDRQLQIKFGISLEQYEEMLESQGGLCAICSQPETTKASTGEGINSLAVDHNHETGQVRGLLCQKCNHALGLLGDDPDRLIAAAMYLAQNETTTAIS